MNTLSLDVSTTQAPVRLTRRTLLLGVAAGTGFALVSRLGRTVAAEPRIRFVNAALPEATLDIYVDGALASEAVPFGEASKILPLPSAPFEVAVVRAGERSSATLASRRMELDPQLTYEVAIFGESPDLVVQEFGVVLLPLEPEGASLRLVHLAPDVSAVGYGLARSALFADDVIYPGATPYTSVTTAPVDLGIYTTQDAAQLLAVPGLELTVGKVHSLYLIGRSADDSLRTTIVSWWAERQSEETGAALSDEERAYLAELPIVRSLVMDSLVNLDEVLMNGSFSGAYLNMLAWVCIGFVTAEQGLLDLTPPPRYADMHQMLLSAVVPLADGARAVSTVEEWMNDEADAVNFTTSDLTPLLQAVANALPVLQQADAMLLAAFEEAGIAPE